MAEVARQLAEERDPTSEVMSLQMGPSHPATHGTIKFNLKLDGEKILDCEVEIGYLHRGFEKMCEQRTWNHVVPYTDRLNYASPLINNVAFALAAEKLLDLQVPDRCQYIRMIMSEISRITDHLTCLGMSATEAGAGGHRRTLDRELRPGGRGDPGSARRICRDGQGGFSQHSPDPR